MKAKVIIENGETTIVLTPENTFEIDVIEKVYCKKDNYSVYTIFGARYNYGVYCSHSIEMSINEIRP